MKYPSLRKKAAASSVHLQRVIDSLLVSITVGSLNRSFRSTLLFEVTNNSCWKVDETTTGRDAEQIQRERKKQVKNEKVKTAQRHKMTTHAKWLQTDVNDHTEMPKQLEIYVKLTQTHAKCPQEDLMIFRWL